MIPTRPTPSDYPLHETEKLRYSDTDRQGHVNNAIFSTLLEVGRVALLHHPDRALNDTGCAFVIANLNLDFLGEINWPGEVLIGTRVQGIGNSSITLDQALFHGGQCVSISRSVVVQMNEATRRAQPLSPDARIRLAQFMASAG